MAGFLLLEHLIRLLGEPHKPFAEVLQSRVRIVFWSVIVLWSGVCVWMEANGDHATLSVRHIQMPRRKGGEGVNVQGRICEWGSTEFSP